MPKRILPLSLLILWLLLINGFAESIPTEVSFQEMDPPKRLETDQMVSKLLEVGHLDITSEKHQMQVRFSISNRDKNPHEVIVTTAFIKTDGSIVKLRQPGPITQGIIRATMSIASLGLSEFVNDDRIQNATIRTTHKLIPDESVMIEHQLPYPDEYVVGSYTFISWINPDIKEGNTDDTWAKLDEEDARYDKEIAEIQAELDKWEWGSPEWETWNEKYWNTYNEHFKRRTEIFDEHQN